VDEDGIDEESGRDVYSQYTRIKDPTARRDAARLGKADRGRLPRVTAYCTANRYEMEGLMRFLKGRGKNRGANPKLIDECIYTPYSYTAGKAPTQTRSQGHNQSHHWESRHDRQNPVETYERRHSTGSETVEEAQQRRESLAEAQERNESQEIGNGYSQRESPAEADIGHISTEELLGPSIVDDGPPPDIIPDFDTTVHTPEAFLFDYGVVVIWGMTEAQEVRFLKDVSKFEIEKLAPDDVETEHFNFYYTREYQARIYNDFITLRDKNHYMTKLAISHALAQSVKVCLSHIVVSNSMD
jgi:uncharacterized Rmd1/YagE family protein